MTVTEFFRLYDSNYSSKDFGNEAELEITFDLYRKYDDYDRFSHHCFDCQNPDFERKFENFNSGEVFRKYTFDRICTEKKWYEYEEVFLDFCAEKVAE